MKAAWSDEPTVTFHGRFRDVDGLPIQPKPVQRPHPPIWFGGNAPKAVARAVRLGDAFMGAGSSTTANFAEAVRIVRRELDEQGKDPTRFTIGKRVYLMVDDDPARARERVVAGLHRIYGDMPGIDAVPVSGTPDDVGARTARGDRRGRRDDPVEPRRRERRRGSRADGTACCRSDSAAQLTHRVSLKIRCYKVHGKVVNRIYEGDIQISGSAPDGGRCGGDRRGAVRCRGRLCGGRRHVDHELRPRVLAGTAAPMQSAATATPAVAAAVLPTARAVAAAHCGGGGCKPQGVCGTAARGRRRLRARHRLLQLGAQ